MVLAGARGDQKVLNGKTSFRSARLGRVQVPLLAPLHASWVSLAVSFPTRRAAAARPRALSAARVGPVVYGLRLTLRGDGYG